MQRAQKIFWLILAVLITHSCTNSPWGDNNGLILRGKVEFNGLKYDNLYIKVIKDIGDDYYSSGFDPFGYPVVDSIKVENDGTYQKYLYDADSWNSFLLMIYNDEVISSYAFIPYYSDSPIHDKDLYLYSIGYIKLNVIRDNDRFLSAEVNISSDYGLKYTHSLFEPQIDTFFTHKIIKGDCSVSYVYSRTSHTDSEFEKHTFTKSFYDDFSDTLFYTLRLE